MWLCRVRGKFSSSVNMDVLDVGFERARKDFKLCELGCARCGFLESEEIFQVL